MFRLLILSFFLTSAYAMKPDFDKRRITRVSLSEVDPSVQSLAQAWDENYSDRKRYALIQIWSDKKEICAIEATVARAKSLMVLINGSPDIGTAKSLLQGERKDYLLTCESRKKTNRDMIAKKQTIRDADFEAIANLEGI